MANTDPSRNKTIEQQALTAGIAINLTMALAGWLAYYLSRSQALLLDGNFSFLMVVSLFVAMRISAIKEKRTALFPYGQFVYEALYSLLKGIMISGVLLVTFIQNTLAVLHYLGGGATHTLNTPVILVYSIAMVLLCFGSAIYYRLQNQKMQGVSTILRAEYSGAIVDGFMSAGIGVALVGIRYIDLQSSFGFLHYIGDSLLVLLLCVLLGKGPIVLIRDSFIELAGGTLQDGQGRVRIEAVLNQHLHQPGLLTGSYISKTGSQYLVVAYLDVAIVEQIGSEGIREIRRQIVAELGRDYPNILFETVLA